MIRDVFTLLHRCFGLCAYAKVVFETLRSIRVHERNESHVSATHEIVRRAQAGRLCSSDEASERHK